jgi:putative acetyltransferase
MTGIAAWRPISAWTHGLRGDRPAQISSEVKLVSIEEVFKEAARVPPTSRRVREGSRGNRDGRVLIRAEEQRDWVAVHAVNVSAFETPAEANLVDALRDQAQPLVSLIAEDNGAIVGHIMFSPVSLSGHPALRIMGLAPMAVAPEHQRKGIGSALVHAGLDQCRQLGFGAVAVLGHSAYYPRFGFASSTRFGIGCEYEVPEEVFMVVELQAGFLDGASGNVKYHAAFSAHNSQ